ncbi:hypothetical protein [Actinomadura parmotrematis]|uniref:Uncharacterized protein n=1 Tax=Actinomadura parmotrematis TaxID=2864039 RepID=A0ABS7FUP8_9ACTN|nr:hypothetical protein [Actinomadura parmotrematis]MBW8483233.1 hypothetical protein [Actinomadura parmotrematis]
MSDHDAYLDAVVHALTRRRGLHVPGWEHTEDGATVEVFFGPDRLDLDWTLAGGWRTRQVSAMQVLGGDPVPDPRRINEWVLWLLTARYDLYDPEAYEYEDELPAADRLASYAAAPVA